MLFYVMVYCFLAFAFVYMYVYVLDLCFGVAIVSRCRAIGGVLGATFFRDFLAAGEQRGRQV